MFDLRKYVAGSLIFSKWNYSGIKICLSVRLLGLSGYLFLCLCYLLGTQNLSSEVSNMLYGMNPVNQRLPNVFQTSMAFGARWVVIVWRLEHVG